MCDENEYKLRHTLVDVTNACPVLLHDSRRLYIACRKVVEDCGFKVSFGDANMFDEHGISLFMVLDGGSHLSLHTWPQWGYYNADLFCCRGDIDPRQVLHALVDAIGGIKLRQYTYDRDPVVREAGVVVEGYLYD